MVFLGVECIQSEQPIRQAQGFNQLLGGLNLMVFVAIVIGDPDVAEHQGGVGGQCAQHLRGLAVFGVIEAAAEGLAVHGDTGPFRAFAIQFAGMRKHGWVGYWTHLVPHGLPWWLVPLVWIIEVIGLFTKPFALMVRLFANMTAGHAIIAVLIGFMWGVTAWRGAFVEVTGTFSAFAFMLFMMLFETLVALIQAFIFTILTAIFMSVAVAEEH